MKKAVIDASFVLKALLSSESKAAAVLKKLFKEQEKKKTKIYTTFFMPLEVANGLRFSLNDQKLAEEIFSKFILLNVEYFTLNGKQTQSVLLMSYNLNTTIYDTSYHFLAKLLGGEFYTCDREYFQKTEKEGNIVLVK